MHKRVINFLTWLQGDVLYLGMSGLLRRPFLFLRNNILHTWNLCLLLASYTQLGHMIFLKSLQAMHLFLLNCRFVSPSIEHSLTIEEDNPMLPFSRSSTHLPIMQSTKETWKPSWMVDFVTLFAQKSRYDTKYLWQISPTMLISIPHFKDFLLTWLRHWAKMVWCNES